MVLLGEGWYIHPFQTNVVQIYILLGCTSWVHICYIIYLTLFSKNQYNHMLFILYVCKYEKLISYPYPWT